MANWATRSNGASISLRSSMVTGVYGVEQAARQNQHRHAQYKSEAAGDRVRRTRVQRGHEAGGRDAQRIGEDGDGNDYRQEGKTHPRLRIGEVGVYRSEEHTSELQSLR